MDLFEKKMLSSYSWLFRSILTYYFPYNVDTRSSRITRPRSFIISSVRIIRTVSWRTTGSTNFHIAHVRSPLWFRRSTWWVAFVSFTENYEGGKLRRSIWKFLSLVRKLWELFQDFLKIVSACSNKLVLFQWQIVWLLDRSESRFGKVIDL